MHFFQDTVERMSKAVDEAEIISAWRSAIRHLGPTKEMYGHWYSERTKNPDGEVLATNYSDEWLEDYPSLHMRTDPIIVHAARSPLPFDWRDTPIETDEQAGFMHLAAEAEGLKFGISATLPAGPGKHGAISLACEHDCDFREIMGDAYAVTSAMHMAVLHQRSAIASNAFGLTPRELELLRWLKEGKSYWEISSILSIAEGTVRAHVHNCYRKLGVHDGTLAVTKALSLGLIDL